MEDRPLKLQLVSEFARIHEVSVILYQIGQKKQTLFRPFLKKFSENRRFIKRVVSFPIVFYSNLILSSERQVESSAYKAREIDTFCEHMYFARLILSTKITDVFP